MTIWRSAEPLRERSEALKASVALLTQVFRASSLNPNPTKICTKQSVLPLIQKVLLPITRSTCILLESTSMGRLNWTQSERRRGELSELWCAPRPLRSDDGWQQNTKIKAKSTKALLGRCSNSRKEFGWRQLRTVHALQSVTVRALAAKVKCSPASTSPQSITSNIRARSSSSMK